MPTSKSGGRTRIRPLRRKLIFTNIIVVITFILSLIGGLFGKKIGSVFKKIAPFIGGLVLIIIGISILVEHIG